MYKIGFFLYCVSLYATDGLISHYDHAKYIIGTKEICFGYSYTRASKIYEPVCMIALQKNVDFFDSPKVSFLFKNTKITLNAFALNFFLQIKTENGLNLTESAPGGIIRLHLVEQALTATGIGWRRVS